MSGQELAGRRVLVVEDEYLIASDVAEMLGRAGVDVVGPVASVRDALDALDPLPDVASLDVKLGDETSFPIADELTRRGVPFVFATGSPTDIPSAHRGRTVCQKPVLDAVLLQALIDALSTGLHPSN